MAAAAGTSVPSRRKAAHQELCAGAASPSSCVSAGLPTQDKLSCACCLQGAGGEPGGVGAALPTSNTTLKLQLQAHHSPFATSSSLSFHATHPEPCTSVHIAKHQLMAAPSAAFLGLFIPRFQQPYCTGKIWCQGRSCAGFKPQAGTSSQYSLVLVTNFCCLFMLCFSRVENHFSSLLQTTPFQFLEMSHTFCLSFHHHPPP